MQVNSLGTDIPVTGDATATILCNTVTSSIKAASSSAVISVPQVSGLISHDPGCLHAAIVLKIRKPDHVWFLDHLSCMEESPRL